MDAFIPQVFVKMVPEVCFRCGVHFAMDERYWSEKNTNGGTFYCPNGHGQHYTEPEVVKLEQRIRSLNAWTQTLENNLGSERRKHAATKGKLTKTNNRIAAGVCPCCNRSFANVNRHMAGQHPEFVAASKAK